MFESFLLLFFIVLFAAILQSSTGYGFSIIGTPFLLLLFPAHTAIQVNIILSILLSIFMLRTIWRDIDWIIVLRLIKGSSFGLIFGLFIYLYLNINILKIGVGILIISLTVLLIFKFTISQSKSKDYSVGAASGFLTTSIGVPGPPLLLYFTGTHMTKAVLRSSTLAYYLFVYTISLALQISFGGTTKEAWSASIIAVPTLFFGIFIGQFIFKKLNPFYFKIVTYIILIFTGSYLLYDGLNVYFNQ